MNANIHNVVICRNVREMDLRFNEYLTRYRNIIARFSKKDRRIVMKNGYTLLFVTEGVFYDPRSHWRQGRTYRIYGDRDTVYHGEFPIKKYEEKKENEQGNADRKFDP